MKLAALLTAVSLAALATAPALSQELPHLQRNGKAIQLMVDGKPYIGLGGELHNSAPSSPAYMAPIWDKLEKNGVDTVVGVASWEQVEPVEGQYDFAAVDDQIAQAKAHNIKLVMIWFGAYKNGTSTYAPHWVRADEERFPRAERDPDFKSTRPLREDPVLSVFSDELAESDAKAFAALMAHIESVDTDQTVIMVQVQNEVGLLHESRDRSPTADAAWGEQVPAALIDYITENRENLRPELLAPWARHGSLTEGTWAEVFGSDNLAEEIFMTWGFADYIERVAKAGSAEYGLPMYANAWLGPQLGAPNPGDYPTGGPVARMMDVYKAAAPTLVLLAPDIYVTDFEGTLVDFKRDDNPIFIPEARFDAGNLFVALGKYDAIMFAPFGIEDKDDDQVFQAYHFLDDMTDMIATAQQDGTIYGFRIPAGGGDTHEMAGYDLQITQNRGQQGAFGTGTATADETGTEGYGFVINTGPDEFLLVGRAFAVNFAKDGSDVEVSFAQEGVFEDGEWVPGRIFNGDERRRLIPPDSLRAVKVRLLTR